MATGGAAPLAEDTDPLDSGDTVREVYQQLGALIANGKADERLWVEVMGPTQPGTLYSGQDEDADPIGYVGVQ